MSDLSPTAIALEKMKEEWTAPLRARVAEVEEALRPFADWSDKLVGINRVGDACPLSADPAANVGCATVADLRRARAVLARMRRAE